ncbi:hypothetical protein GF366_02520, partial [Candidatus Peregrinibacteria bacterium]|nr:hypothetical protein [Candidatus Peregrinibacteria bacterium]
FRWSYHHLDAIWPFFILLSFLSIAIAFEKKSWALFFLGGFSAGIAFLTKEVAMLFFACPVFAFLLISKYRNRSNFIGIALYSIVLTVTIFPWLIYCHTALGGAEKILGKGGPKLINDFMSPPEVMGKSGMELVDAYFRVYILVFWDYYKQLSKWFMLAPAFVIAWGFIVYKAVLGKDRFCIFILLYGVAFMPIVWWIGYIGLRPGQSVIFYLLSFLVFSNLLWAVLAYLRKLTIRFWSQRNLYRETTIFGCCVILTLMVGQVFIGSGSSDNIQGHHYDIRMREALSRSYFVQNCLKDDVPLTVRKDRQTLYAKQWIKDNIPEGSNVMWDSDERLRYYTMEAKVKNVEVPYKRLSDAADIQKEHGNSGKTVILIESKNPSKGINILTEETLIEELKKNNVEYVINGWRKHYLRFYFENNDSFEFIKSLENGKILIFKVREYSTSENKIKTFVDKRVINYLVRLNKGNTSSFALCIKKLSDKLGWEKDKICELLDLRDKRISGNFVLAFYRRQYQADKYPKSLLLR